MRRVLALCALGVIAAVAIWFLIPSAEPPCIVLFSVDTLRADRLGCYGNDRWDTSPSPVADGLAAEGILFENFSAPRGQTHPSIASMLLGKYPITHELRENGQKPRPGQVSFVELLAEGGYATAGFVANLQAYTFRTPQKPAWWTHGFETFGDGYGGRPIFEVQIPLQDQWGWDKRVEEQAIEWIGKQARKEKEPFFLWVHFFDVHKPYLPERGCPYFMPDYTGPLLLPDRKLISRYRYLTHPEEGRERAGAESYDKVTPAIDQATLSGKSLAPEDHDYVLACYDAGVAGADGRIGRILMAMENAGLMDNTWVVYTSDHGEELGDHNNYYYHGASIYESVLRIPLLVRAPRESVRAPREDVRAPRGTRTAALCQNLDLAPTFLELAGITPPEEMEGISLLGLFTGKDRSAGRELAVAEWQDLIYSVSDGSMKYIFNPRKACPVKPPWVWHAGSSAPQGFVYEREELYDLLRDPGEQSNIVAERQNVAREFKKRLGRWLNDPARQGGFSNNDDLSSEEKEILERLGYTAPSAERRDIRF